MKLQHLAVIFAIIFLPIILITSYYIQRQVDTIDNQLSYDSKLLDATYDAMTALEINTANEDLSVVADSLRSIIEACNNIFLNTLATNMGLSNASKSYVQPYIPAILYTLYDGYYIYAPTSSATVCTDKYGQTISVGDYGVTLSGTVETSSGRIGVYEFTDEVISGELHYDATNAMYFYGDADVSRIYPRYDSGELSSTEARNGPTVNFNDLKNIDGCDISSEYGQLLYKNKDGTYSTVLHTCSTDTEKSTEYTQSYILKSFISYTANYSSNGNYYDFDIVVNYTLDNFISINGTVDGVYYTKSGYLIDKGLVTSVIVDENAISWYTYSEEEIEEKIDNNANITVTLSDGTFLTMNQATGLGDTTTTINEDIASAIEYYVEAWMFSSWVYEYLGDLREDNINQTATIAIENDSGTTNSDLTSDENDASTTSVGSELIYDFSDSDTYLFSKSSENPKDNLEDPEDSDSNFERHKRNVMKNSINYNLALAMVSYTEMSSINREYTLPVFSDEDWDTLLSNISIATFMQGLSCGLKYYNNYAIATSVNNELTVTPSEIYYVAVEAETTLQYSDGSGVTGTKDLYTDITDDAYESYNSTTGAVSSTYFIETAHRIDCPDLDDKYIFNGTEYNVDYYISFKSKEIKYDKIWDSSLNRYTYDHKVYLDYNCIVNDNYLSLSNTRGNYDLLDTLVKSGNTSRLRAYRIAVAKERNNLYKSIDYSNNYGYSYSNDINNTTHTVTISDGKNVQEVYKVEITVSNPTSASGVYSDYMNVYLTSGTTTRINKSTKEIPTSSGTSNTVYEFSFDVPATSNEVNGIEVTFGTNDSSSTSVDILGVKIYYK